MHPVVKYVNNKWKRGHSPLIGICGETNTGKTYTALGMADILTGGKFNPGTNMFVDMRKFIYKFSTSNHEVFIIDEAKIHLDTTRYWEDLNKLFADIIATQRHRNNLYIVIMPLIKGLAKQHRDMLDVIIEMKSPGWAMTYIVNRRWSEIQHFELWKSFMGAMTIPLPRKELIDSYKKVEKESKDSIMNDIIKKTIKVKKCGCGKRNPDIDGCEWCGNRVGV